jgi:hypothetical protein
MALHIDPSSNVITVGTGRGFVVMTRHRHLVRDQSGKWQAFERPQLIVTAAHCLPHFPPCHGASYTEEPTYPNLIGLLGEPPSVWAECLFIDPIADIAVLGEPDNQDLSKQYYAYAALIEATPALCMGDQAENPGTAWLLSLDRQWLRCDVEHYGGPWWIRNLEKPGIQSGMSGSPIFNHNRTAAIGVVCLGNDGSGDIEGPNPRLTINLPAWMAPLVSRVPRRNLNRVRRMSNDKQQPDPLQLIQQPECRIPEEVESASTYKLYGSQARQAPPMATYQNRKWHDVFVDAKQEE